MPRNLISSDATIKAVRSGGRRKRLTDGDGLYPLLIVKAGADSPASLLAVSIHVCRAHQGFAAPGAARL